MKSVKKNTKAEKLTWIQLSCVNSNKDDDREEILDA